MPTFNIKTKAQDVEGLTQIPFPSIEQFKNFVKELKHVYKGKDATEIPKSFHLRGTVKLHGTHADVIFQKSTDDSIPDAYDAFFQSRNRVLSLEKDNCGFVRFMEKKPMDELFNMVKAIHKENITTLMVAGEFCGGNIQKGVALCHIPQCFVIFALKIDGTWMNMSDFSSIELPAHGIYNIARAGEYHATMDINDTQAVVADLIALTEKVEKECPFGKTFSVSGTGEGIVWVCEEHKDSSRYWFKVKGEEHAVSKVKTLKDTTPEEKEQLKNVATFISKALPEARLRQGLDYLREMNLERSIKNIGTYISWIVKDVLKEDGDTIESLRLDVSKVKKGITPVASTFYKRVIMEEKDDFEKPSVLELENSNAV